MKFSYNWLQSFFNRKLLKPEKLAEILTMHFAEAEEVKPSSSRFAYAREVEEIKKKGNDFILDIDVRPNRAGDCFSHFGIAREISAIMGLPHQELPVKFKEVKNRKVEDFILVEVKDKKTCFRYSVKVITDVKVGPSPKWLRERLKVCGLRPINNIVDIANYVMLETGQPLHAFDGDKLANKKIIVRFAKKGEKIVALDEEKYDLDDDILVIADNKNPIAIAGIKGGKLPEIDKKTKTIVLEAANFNPQIIRKGSRKLNLRTDASLRFEHGIDPNLTETAINRSCYLLEKIARGKAVFGLADFFPARALPKRIKLDLNYLENLLGVKIPEKEIIKILKSLGLKIEFFVKSLTKGKILNVAIPTFRPDISMPEDLIEEVGRIYGYEKIPAIFPSSVLIPPKRNLNIFWEEMVKNILKEAGFTEVYNYSFFSEKEVEFFDYQKRELIELKNPLSEEQKYLRASLIPGLLKNVEKNFKQFSEIRIFELSSEKEGEKRGLAFFELGKTFKSPKNEKRMLSGAMAGDVFYRLKGVVDLLLNKLGISQVWYDQYQPTPEESKISVWHSQKCAEIKINGQEIGFLGEISPKILSSLEIKEKVVLFDINFEKLSQFVSEEHQYQVISRYPAAVRDIAVLVPQKVKVEEVLNKIERAGGDLIRDVDLFDIYESEELPEEKKSLAFRIIYQAQDRTLTSEEINQIQNRVINALEKEEDWEVRK